MSRDVACATCEAVRVLTGQGITEVVAIAVKLRKPPELIVRHLADHDRAALRDLLTDEGKPLPEPIRRTIPKPTPVTRKEETPVTTTPTTRPPAAELLAHPDKRIARQAAKVQAEQAKLTDLWNADQGKAELRAKRDRLKAQLAKIEAELRGEAQALPSKQIREWAAANGMPCPTTGKIPGAVVDAWRRSERAS